MIFTELRFFAFFAAVFAVYWALSSNRWRKVFLLAASYVFYAAWDWRFVSLLVASTVVDYGLGRILSDPTVRRRKAWLVVSMVLNLGFLGFFKYHDFFAASAMDLLAMLGVRVRLPLLELILPAGISFYTFMSMSYTIDVYRGHKPAKSLLDFAVFVAFFPHLVAGPILRASQFLHQFDDAKRWRDVDARGAFGVFLVGYAKKACIADNLAPIVDRYFADPAAYDAKAATIAVVCYAVQIYCDFSGYSDMAIGVAKLLGYDLCKNFDAPYLSSSVTEFWRRWHISLSNWLRDYVYVPLGGNRGTSVATYRNLLLTMLIGGLWHGAAWTFVVWGGLHGLALAVERLLGVGGAKKGAAPRAGAIRTVVGTAVTFWFVCVAWIFFRATSFRDALVVLRSFVLWHSPGKATFPALLLAVLAVLALAHVAWRALAPAVRWRRAPGWAFAVVWGALFAAAVACVPLEHRPFIYFQF